jgi:hypothetical protein
MTICLGLALGFESGPREADARQGMGDRGEDGAELALEIEVERYGDREAESKEEERDESDKDLMESVDIVTDKCCSRKRDLFTRMQRKMKKEHRQREIRPRIYMIAP